MTVCVVCVVACVWLCVCVCACAASTRLSLAVRTLNASRVRDMTTGFGLLGAVKQIIYYAHIIILILRFGPRKDIGYSAQSTVLILIESYIEGYGAAG